MTPFFSIIIPTYNRAHLIKETLVSFQKQNFKDFEVLIIDDGGKDSTQEIVESLNDNRFRYYWKENAERGAARNYGATLTNGQYLNFFDDDDIAYSNHLSTAYDIILSNKEIDLFCVGQESKDKNGKVYFVTQQTKLLGNWRILENNFVNPNSIFLKRNIFNPIKFSEDRDLSGSEDWLFILQLSLQCNFYCYLQFITNCLIQHDSRSMVTASGKSTETRLIAFINELKNKGVAPSIVKKIKAEMSSLTSLHYALECKKTKSIKFLIIAIFASPKKILTKRFLAIIKHLALCPKRYG